MLDNPYVTWLAALVAALAVVLVLHRIAFWIALRATERTRYAIDNALVRRARDSTLVLVLLLAALALLPSAPFGDEVRETLRRTGSLAITATLGWLAIALTGAVEDFVEARYDISQADNLTARQVRTRTRILRRVAVAAIVIVTVCLMLMSFPAVRQIGVSLFASAGVAGLVIGLAARPVLSNLIAGIQLALTDPMRIDDVVIVEGEWGWIEEITSTYVVVRVWDLRRLVVPLTYFIEKPFQNWTRRSADILGSVFIYADYTVPVGQVRNKLFEILDGHELWDGKVKTLQVTNTTERTVELRALVSATSSGRAWDLRCDVREKLLAWLQAEHPDCLPRARVELSREAPADATRLVEDETPASVRHRLPSEAPPPRPRQPEG
jgi:small-conductance mechanosensitive channel